MKQVKIFAGSASQALGEHIAAAFGTTLGDLTLQRFADSEMGPSFNESIRAARCSSCKAPARPPSTSWSSC